MNILIVSAAPFSGLEHCLPLLQQAGVALALPADTPAGPMTPSNWHQRLLAAQGHHTLLQAPSGVVVGKMWEELAINLLLANMNQPVWGFADERAIWVMPFWAGLDPQTRFALGYVSLGQAVALYKHTQPEAGQEDIHALAQAWVAWNSELLSFVQKTAGRAMLFNLQEAAEHPNRLAHTCVKKLGIDLPDVQALPPQTAGAWPPPEDITQLRLPNLGAVRSLQKKLEAARTALLNPNTQVMTTPAADKATAGWSLLGLFKSKQLTQELEHTRFELQKAQAELTQAQEHLQDLQAQHEQAQVDAQRRLRLLEQDLQTEKDKAQTALKEQQQESELLLQQLHQVQEELEQIFLDREEVKQQLQQAQQAHAQAHTQAQQRVTELEQKAQQLQAAVSSAEAAAAAAEKKAADLAAQLQAASAQQPEHTRALQEAQEENDLLLKQLHQVQEELENYFLKTQETDQQRHQLKERLDRVLLRVPSWADAEQISITPLANESAHRSMRVQLQNLWVGQDEPVAQLSLVVGRRQQLPYLEFRPGPEGVAKKLLPWPEAMKDAQGERLLIAPGASGPEGKALAGVVAGLTASQWRLIKGLLVLIGSQINRLGLRDQADRLYWVNVTRDLTQSLDDMSSGVHFESAEVMAITQPEPGTEVMRVAIRDLTARNTRLPLCVFEIGIKYKINKSGPVPQTFFIDFRPWKGAVMPFVNFQANCQDAQGEFLRISVARTGRQKNRPDIHELIEQDLQLLGLIGQTISTMVSEKTFKRFATGLSEQFWMNELEEVGLILYTAGQEIVDF